MQRRYRATAIVATLVFCLGICWPGLLWSGAALAQNSLAANGMTIEEVAAVMDGEGASAEVSDGGEAGKITSELSGVDFEVFSVNCDSKRCTEYLFIVGFDLPQGFPLELINDWNAQKLGGRAYLDHEGDPFLDHVISVSGPGDAGAFREGLYLWGASLDAFIDYIELPSASV